MATLLETPASIEAEALASSAKWSPSSGLFYRSFKEEHRMPTVVSGHGIWFKTDEDIEYLDACGGAAVACLGSGHPKVLKAICDQVQQLTFTYSGAFTHPSAEALAARMVQDAHGAFAKVLLLAGGSEAMEASIKMARQYWCEVGQPQRKNFIARHMSYHGNTLGALSLCHHPARRAIYAPLLNDTAFHHVSPAYAYRYAKPDESEQQFVQRLQDELEAKFQELGPDTVAAFCAETAVGATIGVCTPPKGYLKAMKEVCDRHGALFMLDEVMSGMGRLGSLHAWETYGDGVTPDIQACAKGLGGGFQAIGACLVSERVASAVKSGTGMLANGHTYVAHPVACAAALAVQNVIREEKLLDNCTVMGEYFHAQLQEKLSANPVTAKVVGEIRGRGMWWAIEFVRDNTKSKDPFPSTLKPRFGERVGNACLSEQHMSIMAFSGGIDGKEGDHIIFAPPYNVTKEELDIIVERFVKGLESAIKGV